MLSTFYCMMVSFISKYPSGPTRSTLLLVRCFYSSWRAVPETSSCHAAHCLVAQWRRAYLVTTPRILSLFCSFIFVQKCHLTTLPPWPCAFNMDVFCASTGALAHTHQITTGTNMPCQADVDYLRWLETCQIIYKICLESNPMGQKTIPPTTNVLCVFQEQCMYSKMFKMC